jgi:hypothetical protein
MSSGVPSSLGCSQGRVIQLTRPAISFLDRSAPDFYVEWDSIANDIVAILRAEAGRDAHDRALQDLIGELSTRSEEFRVRWAAHNVQVHWSGVKNFRHPVVGDLTVAYESLECPGGAGQSIFVYMAEPTSPSQEALDLLASWATTPASISAEKSDE